MAANASLHPYCAPELPGVPAPMLDAYINRAWFDLAKQSLCWSEWQSIALRAGVATYELETPSDGAARIHLVITAQQGSNILSPRGIEQQLMYDAAQAERRGTPNGYRLEQNKDFIVYPIPQADDIALPIRALVAFVPVLTATTIPDQFAEKYLDTLIAGAKAKLMAMVGQPWSNPQAAAYWNGVFEAGITDAVVERMKGGTQAAITVRPRLFM